MVVGNGLYYSRIYNRLLVWVFMGGVANVGGFVKLVSGQSIKVCGFCYIHVLMKG